MSSRLYSVDAYLAQDLPEELREDFTSLHFERFGIGFADVDQFVKVVLDCCSYRNVGAANGPRVYVFDGSLDLDAVRDKLEEEGFQSRMYGDYEAWEKQVLAEKFRGLDNFAAAFLTEEGYLVMGAVDGIREILHELDRASEDEGAMERVLARMGDAWDGERPPRCPDQQQRQHALRSRCDLQEELRSDSALHPLLRHTADDGGGGMVYGSAEDAQSESERIESNFENVRRVRAGRHRSRRSHRRWRVRRCDDRARQSPQAEMDADILTLSGSCSPYRPGA